MCNSKKWLIVYDDEGKKNLTQTLCRPHQFQTLPSVSWGKKSFMHGNDRYTEVLQSCQKPQHFHNCFLTKSSAVYLFRKLVGSYFTSDLVQNCTSQQQGFEYICDSMVKNAKMCHISTFRIYIDITTYNNYANSIYLHM